VFRSGERFLLGSGCVRSLLALAAVSSLAVACSRGARPEVTGEGSEAAPRAVASSEAAAIEPGPSAAQAAVAAPVSAPGVAVVELFTSEGCSSCPPADRVLGELVHAAARDHQAVYALSFHVDYWNYLGWRDRFSNSEYSERQRRYHAINPGSGTYTPQIVVNGEAETVGSNASRVRSLVAASLGEPAHTTIELGTTRVGASIRVTYRVSGASSGRVLNLALLEPHAESAVNSGENAGERLAHENVVRDFSSRSLASSTSGEWLIAPRSEFDIDGATVVAFAEGEGQRAISGANAISLR